jgi:hypothetical protein
MTAYEFIVCNNPGKKLMVRENQIRDAEPDEQPSILGIVINETTGEVTCDCSGKIMKRTDKKYPAMESGFHCDVCGKDVSIVWD